MELIYVFRQSYLWWKTHRHDDQWLKDNFYSKKMVLSCSQSLTEGAVQSILQVIIILDNFKNGKVEGCNLRVLFTYLFRKHN